MTDRETIPPSKGYDHSHVSADEGCGCFVVESYQDALEKWRHTRSAGGLLTLTELNGRTVTFDPNKLICIRPSREKPNGF